MIDYKGIFEKVENTIKAESWFSKADFQTHYDKFKVFENAKRSDQEIFDMLTMIVFYSGFKASIVENKGKIILNHIPDFAVVSQYTESDFEKIITDVKMIKNTSKILACIANARVFESIVNEYKSFQNYLDTFEADASFENLMLLKEELEHKFNYLGGITVYHFLTDLGFDVLKPDRVIFRIFKRLGLIENDKQVLKAIIVGRKFAMETGYPIRYIDIIFVKYGQQGESNMFGLKNGICLEDRPNCRICRLAEYCNYYKNNEVTI